MKTNSHSKRVKIISVLVGLVAAIALNSVKTVQADTWTRKADMPTARLTPKAEVVNGKIYVISGVYANLQKIEAYDPATDSWAAKTPMPTSRSMPVTGAVNGKIYVMGGESSLGSSARATVEAYDPATDRWTRKADMPTPRARAASSVVDGKIYVFGGARGGGGSYPEMATVEAYDPATDTWTRKADMPAPRELLTTSVVGGKIYAICGQREDGTHRNVYRTVDMYDPATDSWTKKADAPLPRKVHSACVLNDIIYVFGGRNVIGGWPQSTLFQYDPAADTWTVREDMPYEVATAPASLVDGRVYLIGGSSHWPPNQVISTVWEYSPLASPDFNGDGVVDAQDMSMMVDHWHTEASRYDLAPAPAGDGYVDVQDLVALSERLFEDHRLLALWLLDETEGTFAYDSAAENDGIVLGNPVWQPEGGQVGGALEFDGIDDVIIVDPVLNPEDGPFSVFAWIKGGATGQVIVSQEGGVNWLQADDNGALMTELTVSGGRRKGVPLYSETVITDDSWHQVGLVWDGTDRILYMDDIEVARGTLAGLDSADGGLRIGAGNDLAESSFWSGMLDDVRVYDRAVEP
jgi:N-acetylneuraminic acid mutarotase